LLGYDREAPAAKWALRLSPFGQIAGVGFLRRFFPAGKVRDKQGDQKK
jgi:hypothetical protein